MAEIFSKRLNESYQRIEHKSGLTLMLCPMMEFKTAYALFTARVGSINDAFSVDGGKMNKVPQGIAHFLEHKLFESEEGDAFQKYSEIGVSANAYTSFDKTAYLFSCTSNFQKALDILINLVTHPYFTPQTVEKEQGIIGQEIKMYEDDPGWRVYFNLLGALYHDHPIKIDIAGTVESISEITDKTLYECHKAFYNLKNMVLSIAGNFDVDVVLDACDRLLSPSMAADVKVPSIDEPRSVVTNNVRQKLDVAAPLFQLGFKGVDTGFKGNVYNQMTGEVVCEIICGEGSPLYRRLYDEGLINTTFDSDVMAGPSYLATIFSGESQNPERVAELLREEIIRMQDNGIPADAFSRAKKSCYGRYVDLFGSVDTMTGMMAQSFLSGTEPYEMLDRLAGLTLNDAQSFLRENTDCRYWALSVVSNEVE